MHASTEAFPQATAARRANGNANPIPCNASTMPASGCSTAAAAAGAGGSRGGTGGPGAKRARAAGDNYGFAQRRLDARADLIAWLVARVERRHASVIDAMDRLDSAALAGRRRLSIPLARETLHAVPAFTDRSDETT